MARKGVRGRPCDFPDEDDLHPSATEVLVIEIAIHEADIIIDETANGAFTHTDLEHVLRCRVFHTCCLPHDGCVRALHPVQSERSRLRVHADRTRPK